MNKLGCELKIGDKVFLVKEGIWDDIVCFEPLEKDLKRANLRFHKTGIIIAPNEIYKTREL